MRIYKRRKNIKKRLLIVFSVMIAAAVLFVVYYNGKIRPIVGIMAASRLQDIATDIVNEVVYETMTNSACTYDSLVNLNVGSDGTVTSLEIDTVKLNTMKTYITLEVNRRVNALEDVEIEIPVGSLTRLEMLAAVGPKLHIHVLPVGSTYGTVHQEFTQAGINQVRHRIYIRVTVEADLILPTETQQMEYHSDFIVAETVIVGVSPEMYAQLSDAMSYIDEKNILYE